MYVTVKDRAITYAVTLEYGKPDAYNTNLKDYTCEIGIRLDRFWKYYPNFDYFLDKLIFYQLVERICLEMGLMTAIPEYPCNTKKCPMEIKSLFRSPKHSSISLNILCLCFFAKIVIGWSWTAALWDKP